MLGASWEDKIWLPRCGFAFLGLSRRTTGCTGFGAGPHTDRTREILLTAHATT